MSQAAVDPSVDLVSSAGSNTPASAVLPSGWVASVWVAFAWVTGVVVVMIAAGASGAPAVVAALTLAFWGVVVATGANAGASRTHVAALGGAVVATTAALVAAVGRGDGWFSLDGVARWVEAVGIGSAVGLAGVAAMTLASGRRLTTGERLVAWAAGGAAVAAAVVIGTDADSSWAPMWVAAGAVAAAAAPAMHRGYLEADPAERARLQLVGAGIVVALSASTALVALRLFADWPEQIGVAVGAAALVVPIAMLVSQRRPAEGSAHEVLASATAIGVAFALVVAIYIVIVIGLGRVPEGDEQGLVVLSLVAAGVSALVAGPVRERVRHHARRLVAGDVTEADAVLDVFGRRATKEVPLDEVLLQSAETLQRSMPLSTAEVWVGTEGRLSLRASVPDRDARPLTLEPATTAALARAGVSGETWGRVWLPELVGPHAGRSLRIAPITSGGELLGAVLVVAEAGVELGAREDAVLEELVRRMGPVLHNAQLDVALQDTLDEVQRQAEELRDSRARVVKTADAERRRIERDLHDGAQQHLVALSVSLRLARDLVADDPDTATEMLEALGDQVKETVQELRNLAHGIFPPVLVDSGLGAALRAAADRSPLDVVVADEGAERVDTEIEAAVYFCCLEALQNAAKHAPDATVEVRLAREAGGLLFEVADDGPGFDTETTGRGHGFVNMTDRLGAIGGSLRVESTPGVGTRISGAVPLGES